MDKNKMLCYNNIIYHIYNTPDFNKMKQMFLETLNILIPFSGSGIFMADNSKNKICLCDPVSFPMQYETLNESYLENEYMDYSRWARYEVQSTIIKDTDLMPEEKYISTDLYKKCFSLFDIYYSLDMTITDGTHLLGLLQLYRKKEEGDFNEEDIFFLQLLSKHLNIKFTTQNHLDKVEPSANTMLFYIDKYNLTLQESKILNMIFDGRNNDKILDALCISYNTLKKHLQNLYKKTNTNNRMQLQLLQKDKIK